MKRKNIWLIRPTDDSGIKFVDELLKNYECDLLVCNKNFQNSLKQNINEVIINESIIRCKEKVKNFTYSKEFYNNDLFSKYLNWAIHSLDAFDDNTHGFSSSEKFYLTDYYLNFWVGKISNNKPDIVFFFDIPHCIHDIVLLGIVKTLNIKAIIIKNKVQYSMLLDVNLDPIEHKNSITVEEFCEKYLKERKKNLYYRDTNKSDNLIILLAKSVKFFFSFILFYIFDKKLTDLNFKMLNKKNNFDYYFVYKARLFYSNYCFKSFFFKLYSNIYGSIFNVKKHTKFIFWPLPYAFESTMIPSSSPTDILSLARKISNSKNEYKIFIKDHPRQFSKERDQKYARSQYFYKFFKSLKNIVLLKTNQNTDVLIEKSDYVFCSSFSSSFFDAVASNKKIFFYGPIFYCNDKIKHIDDIKKDKIINKKVINIENIFINDRKEIDITQENLISLLNKVNDFLK